MRRGPVPRRGEPEPLKRIGVDDRGPQVAKHRFPVRRARVGASELGSGSRRRERAGVGEHPQRLPVGISIAEVLRGISCLSSSPVAAASQPVPCSAVWSSQPGQGRRAPRLAVKHPDRAPAVRRALVERDCELSRDSRAADTGDHKRPGTVQRNWRPI
jgi:hypothetical protein